jgi:hypothetical protein
MLTGWRGYRTLRLLVGNGSLPPPSGFLGHAVIEYCTATGRRSLREKKEKGDELARVMTRRSQKSQPEDGDGDAAADTGTATTRAGAEAERTGGDLEKNAQRAEAEGEGEGRPVRRAESKVVDEVARRKLERGRQSKWKRLNPLQPLIFILEPDIGISLSYVAVVYGQSFLSVSVFYYRFILFGGLIWDATAVYYCATVSFSTLLQDNYGLGEIDVGLCFIAGGVGA